MNFRFLQGAEQDIDEAADWYDGQSPGLGQEFLDSLAAAFDQIREAPTRHTKHPRRRRGYDFRFLNVDRFPYSIIYDPRPEGVVVFAVAHHKRRPGYWSRRKG